MIVSITVQLFNVCATVMLKYSFTIQNPPSLTCDRIVEPAPIATTSNSKFSPGVLFAIGAMMPAAVVMATVAEPVATRISAATSQPSSIGDMGDCLANAAIASPTPLTTNTRLNPPPAPTT